MKLLLGFNSSCYINTKSNSSISLANYHKFWAEIHAAEKTEFISRRIILKV